VQVCGTLHGLAGQGQGCMSVNQLYPTEIAYSDKNYVTNLTRAAH